MSEVNQASDVNAAQSHEKKIDGKERRLNAIYVAQNLSAPGRGYSFDVMRAKLLLSQRAQKTHRPKFSRYIDGMIMHLPQEEYPTNLGPDITTLAQEIEESFG